MQKSKLRKMRTEMPQKLNVDLDVLFHDLYALIK